MVPDFVVDVGNTRIKWGRCSATEVEEIVGLPLVDLAAWQAQFDQWRVEPGRTWVMTGVYPERREFLVNWLEERRQVVRLLQLPEQLPIIARVERPDQVGIDRLLNAVAANSRRSMNTPAVIVDAGSAVTVDLVDVEGAFRGGAILPGFRLMAQGLKNYTALLPFVEITKAEPDAPGTSTHTAIEAGVYWAVAGGVRALVERSSANGAEVFLTGGDGGLLQNAIGKIRTYWPQMTLEGIRLSAAGISS